MREQPQNLQCGAGCSLCCYGLFEIGSGDVPLIAEGLAKLHPKRRQKDHSTGDGDRRIELLIPTFGNARPRRRRRSSIEQRPTPCPNLDEAGLCVMYEQRPLVCRTFGLPLREGKTVSRRRLRAELHRSHARARSARRPGIFDGRTCWASEDEFTIPEAIVLGRRGSAVGSELRARSAAWRHDVRDVAALASPIDAISLEDRSLFDDQSRRVDVAVHLSVPVNLDPLIGHDLPNDRAADGDASDVDVAFDMRRSRRRSIRSSTGSCR